MSELLQIYQGYVEQAEPDSMAREAYSAIVSILQSSTSVEDTKNLLHATELSLVTSEMKTIFQAARYRVERVLWAH